MTKALFWDFDGTLVHSVPMWSPALLRSLKAHWPDCTCSLEEIRACLRTGFPWHTPEKDSSSLTGQAWWEFMHRHFEASCLSLGAPAEAAAKAARDVRESLLMPENYMLFDDTLPVLERFRSMGFSQYVVSNNHPDLKQVMDSLNLSPYFAGIIVSGEVGFDKPRREIFKLALHAAGNPDICFMLGDNPYADGEGAKNAGIPALLVHLRESAPPGFACFETLSQAADFIEEALHASSCHDHGGL